MSCCLSCTPGTIRAVGRAPNHRCTSSRGSCRSPDIRHPSVIPGPVVGKSADLDELLQLVLSKGHVLPSRLHGSGRATEEGEKRCSSGYHALGLPARTGTVCAPRPTHWQSTTHSVCMSRTNVPRSGLPTAERLTPRALGVGAEIGRKEGVWGCVPRALHTTS